MNLRQIFYVSRAVDDVDERSIRNILAISRRNNRMLDITGCLVCSGRHFAQVLEGREEPVAELIGRIGNDPRHRTVKVLVDRSITLREYPLWAMAYLHDLERADELEGLLQEGSEPTPRHSLRLMARLRPDTVAGAL